MNGGLLNKPFLQKNIEEIDFYANEERLLLIKISEKIKSCTKNYKSTKNSKILEEQNDVQKNINKISVKREKYSLILNKQIEKYDSLVEMTVQKFNGGV